MLGKMIKHEFKATARLYVPLFILVVVLTPLLSLLFRLGDSIGENSLAGTILSGISVGGFILMIVAFCVSAFIYVMVRFYKTVATSEAYLTFCLPVNQHHVVISKLVVATVWQVLSIALSIASIYVMLLIKGIIKPGTVSAFLHQMIPMADGSESSLPGYLIKFGVLLLFAMIASTLSVYLAICLGQTFNEHRVILSFVCYMGIYTVVQVINLVALLPFILDSAGHSGFVVGEVSAVNVDMVNVNNNIPMSALYVICGANIALGIVYYIISTRILKKRTNVR
ncbi:MAG: hypothetical protein K5639_01460 [Eubacterium sp.]|nr:hypothetical protein [Eubacterium sp.]